MHMVPVLLEPYGSTSERSEAMRILIVIPNHYGPPWDEGVKNLARTANEYLRTRGHLTGIASFSGLCCSTNSSGAAVQQRSGRNWDLPDNLEMLRTIVRARRDFRPDVALLFSSCGSFLGLKTMILRRVLNIPLVTYVTGLRSQVRGYNLFLDSDSVVVGSPFLKRYFPSARVMYPFVPVRLQPYSGRSSNGDGRLSKEPAQKFLFLGAWERGRGLEDLLEATAIVRRQAPIRLTVALNSDGATDEHDEVSRLIRKLDLEQTVDLRGIVDVNTAYEECDVVVIPRSRPFRMAFPVRIIESLAMQKPLIVSTVCDMDKLIDGCGLAVEPGEPEGIAAAMLRLATDGELYQRLVANCSSKALEYDSERSLGQMYSELKLAFAGEARKF